MAAPGYTGVPITKGALPPQLLIPGLKRVFDYEVKQRKSLIGTLYHVDSSTRKYEEQHGMGGITNFTEKGETQAITYQGIGKGYLTRWTHVTYANGISHSLEAQEDEQYGVLKKNSSLLAESAADTREIHAVSSFNLAFTTVWNATEGQYLIDSDHPLDPRVKYQGSATYSNLISGSLSIGALQDAIVCLQNTPSPMGRALNLNAKYLVVPPTLQFLAKQILQSDGEYDSPNRTINTIKNSMEVVVSPYLTSNTAWFVIADRHEGYWYNRRTLRTALTEDFDTEVIKQKATMRYSYGFADWRGVVGSTGI